MKKNEFNNFCSKYLDHPFHWTMFWVFTTFSLINWAIEGLRGKDHGFRSDKGWQNVVAPVHQHLVIQYILCLLLLAIVVNMIVLFIRNQFGKDSNGLGHKDRKTLKKAESAAILHREIERLEQEVAA